MYGNLGRQVEDALERKDFIQSRNTDSPVEGVAAILDEANLHSSEDAGYPVVSASIRTQTLARIIRQMM